MLMYYFTVFHLSHSFFHLATSLSFVKSAGSVSWIGSHLFCFRDFVNIAAILSDSLVFSAVSSYISTTSRACFLTAPKALVQEIRFSFAPFLVKKLTRIPQLQKLVCYRHRLAQTSYMNFCQVSKYANEI